MLNNNLIDTQHLKYLNSKYALLMGTDKLAENTPNAPKFVGPSPKFWDFRKKLSLGVRSPCQLVSASSFHLVFIAYHETYLRSNCVLHCHSFGQSWRTTKGLEGPYSILRRWVIPFSPESINFWKNLHMFHMLSQKRIHNINDICSHSCSLLVNTIK